MLSMAKEFIRPKLSLKKQALAAALALVSAVLLPQIIHIAGAAFGVKSALGEMLLPMHLPIILVGFLAGPYAGAIAGLLSPLVSFCLTGMPSFALLPFMCIELLSYGLFAGALRGVKINNALKVLAVQAIGRAVRAATILVSVYALGNESISATIIYSSVAIGLIGILLQLLIIPFVLKRVNDNE